MSDTQQSVMSDVASTRTPLVRRVASRKHFWLFSRLLATFAALLVAVAAWLPWVSFTLETNLATGQFLSGSIQLSPGDLDTIEFGGFVWGTLAVLGLLICLFLWRRAHAWRFPFSPFLYLVWAFAVLVIGGMCAQSLYGTVVTVHLVPELNSAAYGLTHAQHLAGFWLSILGLGLAMLSACALLLNVVFASAPAAQATASEGMAARRPRRTPGGALLVGAAALWAGGTLALPWATVNCTAAPLFFGSCTGLPFSAVAGYGIRTQLPLVDPLAAHYSLNTLLCGGGLLIALAVWRRACSRNFAVWLTLWLIVASLAVALAAAGISIVATDPAALGLPGTGWSGDTGVFVALLGLALGWVGAGYLWVSALRSPRA